jgi:hypothetical protein
MDGIETADQNTDPLYLFLEKKNLVVRCEQMIPVEVTDFCGSGPLSTDASD